jgi:hypothetical protein
MDQRPKCKIGNFEITGGKQRKTLEDVGLGNVILNRTLIGQEAMTRIKDSIHNERKP